MHHEIIFRPETKLWCLDTDITQSHRANGAIIAAHWKKFNHLLRVNQVKLGSNWEKFGITGKADGRYTYSCAFASKLSQDQFTPSIISQGEFARFSHQGAMRFMSRTINKIYKNAIPNLALNIDINRSIVHFERYDQRFQWSDKNSIIDIFIPLGKIKS